MNYTAIFTPAEEGGWIAQCAEVPGANTQGETLDEARENLKDAIFEILKANREASLLGTGPASRLEEVTV